MVGQLLEQSSSLSSFKKRMENVFKNDLQEPKIVLFCDRLWSSVWPTSAPIEDASISSSHKRNNDDETSSKSEKDGQVYKRLHLMTHFKITSLLFYEQTQNEIQETK